ncbi:MAG: hypothetical protein ACE5ES_01605 [Candidatus Nanoarchaeia archaeon]
MADGTYVVEQKGEKFQRFRISGEKTGGRERIMNALIDHGTYWGKFIGPEENGMGIAGDLYTYKEELVIIRPPEDSFPEGTLEVRKDIDIHTIDVLKGLAGKVTLTKIENGSENRS